MKIDSDVNPGKGWPIHVNRMASKTQLDKEYQTKMNRAREVYFEPEKRNFKPLSEVSRQHNSGYTVSYKFGFLTESEFQTAFDLPPKALNLTALQITSEDGTLISGYPIKLFGLPEKILMSCRKVKVWKVASTNLLEQFLAPQAQLAPGQGRAAFEWMCAAELGKRSPALKPTGRDSMHSYESLKEKAQSIIAEREEQEKNREMEG